MPITLKPFIARSCSKLNYVPHIILHLVVYILLHNLKMADRSIQGMEVLLKKSAHLLYRTVSPDFYTAR